MPIPLPNASTVWDFSHPGWFTRKTCAECRTFRLRAARGDAPIGTCRFGHEWPPPAF